METKTNLGESLNIQEMILLYISKNEPMDTQQVEEMIEKSGIDENKLHLNIERLKSAELIDGHLTKGLGNQYFVNAIDLRLSQKGIDRITELLEQKKIIKEMEVNLGLIKFRI